MRPAHRCRLPGCREEVRWAVLLCREHRGLLPPLLRGELRRAWRRCNAPPQTGEEFREWRLLAEVAVVEVEAFLAHGPGRPVLCTGFDRDQLRACRRHASCATAGAGEPRCRSHLGDADTGPVPDGGRVQALLRVLAAARTGAGACLDCGHEKGEHSRLGCAAGGIIGPRCGCLRDGDAAVEKGRAA